MGTWSNRGPPAAPAGSWNEEESEQPKPKLIRFSLVLRRPVEPGLTALVRVMQQCGRFAAAPYGHHQRIGDQLRGHAVMHRPTHDPARVQVHHRSRIQPAFGRPDVSEVGHPLLIRRTCHKLAVEDVVGNGATSANVFGQPPATRPGAQGLLTHQPLDTVQSTAMAQGQYVVPDPARSVGAITAHKALTNMRSQYLVFPAASASGPHQPGIEAASRDTERLAHQIDRPGHPVLRHKLELHSESLAK